MALALVWLPPQHVLTMARSRVRAHKDKCHSDRDLRIAAENLDRSLRIRNYSSGFAMDRRGSAIPVHVQSTSTFNFGIQRNASDFLYPCIHPTSSWCTAYNFHTWEGSLTDATIHSRNHSPAGQIVSNHEVLTSALLNARRICAQESKEKAHQSVEVLLLTWVREL